MVTACDHPAKRGSGSPRGGGGTSEHLSDAAKDGEPRRALCNEWAGGHKLKRGGVLAHDRTTPALRGELQLAPH